jgi:hypothetical protein
MRHYPPPAVCDVVEEWRAYHTFGSSMTLPLDNEEALTTKRRSVLQALRTFAFTLPPMPA